MEIVFGVTQEADGGFVAECLSHDMFTQGNSWDELRRNVQEAVSGYFFDHDGKPVVAPLGVEAEGPCHGNQGRQQGSTGR